MIYTTEKLATYLLGRGAAVRKMSEHLVDASYGDTTVHFHYSAESGKFSWAVVDGPDGTTPYVDSLKEAVDALGLPSAAEEAA